MMRGLRYVPLGYDHITFCVVTAVMRRKEDVLRRRHVSAGEQ